MAFWESWNAARGLLEQNRPSDALVKIHSDQVHLSVDPGLTAALKAQCWEALGDDAAAFDAVMQVRNCVIDNPWYYFTLGRVAWKVGEAEIGFEANRAAHSHFGWPESKIKGYTFTHDFFSPNIPHWEKMFKNDIVQNPIRCLEIGSWQGGSSTWLLDKVISERPGSHLTCVDAFEGSSEHSSYIEEMSIEKIFDTNIISTGYADLCTKIKGYSQDILLDIKDYFDFIYIDGAHEAEFVIQDAFLSW